MIVYAEYLYTGSFEFKDYDGAYYLYQKMLNKKRCRIIFEFINVLSNSR